ncbi:hypothetical protein BDV33DRAFT_170460 [Aspergillus novoparasiticus]|uniref:Uncharacterized protein n=1 Tax=Aspergillus novoparasiticus TaxID=986946 RepID=A0A5N6EX25_9EURO|nr:hypothetical protein BDV33DRAFT_170460 [Aspergillus novoparasiticus]
MKCPRASPAIGTLLSCRPRFGRTGRWNELVSVAVQEMSSHVKIERVAWARFEVA